LSRSSRPRASATQCLYQLAKPNAILFARVEPAIASVDVTSM
jgi:hypothetical protein